MHVSPDSRSVFRVSVKMSRSPILDLAREKLKTTSNAAKSAEGPLILHEGMWDAWRTQFDAGLNAQLLRVTSSESPDMTPYEFKIWTWHAFAYIGMRVSPYVLERVAKTGSKNAFRFLETLRMLAQPFPFFCKPDPKDKGQLSYDERRCVYDHLQELQPRVVNVIFKRPAIGFCEEMTMRDAKVPPCMPAITQVNRALREETRATAIRKTIFKFTILSGESLVGCLQDFEPYLRRWLQNDIREDDDLLWKIRLCTPEDIEMTFAGNVVSRNRRFAPDSISSLFESKTMID